MVDEPNEAHRADPGYEGLPLHIRDIVRSTEGKSGRTPEFFILSPTPSLRLYASGPGIRELPAAASPPLARHTHRGPARFRSYALTGTLVDACRSVALGEGKTVGVVVNRLGLRNGGRL